MDKSQSTELLFEISHPGRRCHRLPESDVPDPERSLWNRQLGLRIDAALGQLTPRERMVFELRHYQGMRLRTIGEILEVPLARPRRRLELATDPEYARCRAAVLEFLYARHRVPVRAAA